MSAIQTEFKNPCFFSAGCTWNKKPSIVDGAVWSDTQNQIIGMYSHKTLEQLREQYPDVEIKETDEAWQLHLNAFIEPPTEITEERFTEMLEVLPPVDWVGKSDAESFKMSEHTTGSITGIYARVGDRYFALQNDVRMKHDEIIAMIVASPAYQKTH